MKTLFCRAFVLVAVLALPATLQAQDTAKFREGYVQSLRSLYERPDAKSEAIGFIEPGEYVRLEHVDALVYRVYRKGQDDPAGYVVYPKIGPSAPMDVAEATPVKSAGLDGEYAATPRGTATFTVTERTRWVHNFANIRQKPNTGSRVLAQLPPGGAVVAGGQSGTWTQVYKPTETILNPARALGYVHSSLLQTTPPKPRKAELAGSGVLEPQSAAGGVTMLVDINRADQRMLETLPRVGPVIAKRIIDFRTTNGSFHSVDDLTKVKGIGDKTLEKLRPYIAVNR